MREGGYDQKVNETVSVVAAKTTELGQKTWGIMRGVMAMASQTVESYTKDGSRGAYLNHGNSNQLSFFGESRDNRFDEGGYEQIRPGASWEDDFDRNSAIKSDGGWEGKQRQSSSKSALENKWEDNQRQSSISGKSSDNWDDWGEKTEWQSGGAVNNSLAPEPKHEVKRANGIFRTASTGDSWAGWDDGVKETDDTFFSLNDEKPATNSRGWNDWGDGDVTWTDSGFK